MVGVVKLAFGADNSSRNEVENKEAEEGLEDTWGNNEANSIKDNGATIE